MSTNLQYQLKENNFVVLVQPQMGLSGEFARHLPLSLLYVAAPLKKMGIEVVILDRRVVHEKSWKNELLDYLGKKPLWIGFTVMAGFPIVQALVLRKIPKFRTKSARDP